MFYDKDARTIEDLEILLIELKAYRELESESFDFGTGLLYSDYTYGSEDVYYKMDIESVEDALIWKHYYNRHYKTHNKHKQRLNKYERKEITLNRYKQLEKISKNSVWYNEDLNRYIKCYYSNRRKRAHRNWIKKLRKTNNFKLKGNSCNKVYHYWDEVMS